MLKNLQNEEELISNIYNAIVKEQVDDLEKYILQLLLQTHIPDYKIISSSMALQKQAKIT